MSGFVRAVCAMLITWLAPLVLAQQPAPALRGWNVELSWSPEYCAANIVSKEPQCTREHYFSISGLRPVLAGAQPTECPEGESLDSAVIEKLIWTVPNRRTLKSMWRDQGLCSGLDRDEYFRQVDRAQRRVAIPSAYRSATEMLDVKAEDLRKAFVAANPGLRETGVRLRCGRSRWLREVLVCLDANFGFRACAAEPAPTCKADVRIRAIKPGQVGR